MFRMSWVYLVKVSIIYIFLGEKKWTNKKYKVREKKSTKEVRDVEYDHLMSDTKS